ncbi:MotA/TolQ/ExbB proton channel family protein [Alkalihalophilus marmarensis]|nr:MotA/TolQ/ExbB proton channel family protein [Alkalihalophilus marmarensis]MCM3491161.1 MotA/TolQ/ExbB proton channel family protein [Alkalihalophilus marmarensis]
MFDIFKAIFRGIESIGLETFTSLYMGAQLLFFIVVLVGWGIAKVGKEKKQLDGLRKVTEGLYRNNQDDVAKAEREISQYFSEAKDSKLRELWNRYERRSKDKKEDERIQVEPFFGFDVMIHHMGYRSLLDLMSGLHISVGVLGTFIGLSAGLSMLEMDGGSEVLSQGITGLISGMEVAFYTSVFGVALSLLWTLIDKSFIQKSIEDKVDWHAEKLDYLLNTDDEELFLNRLEKVTKSQADHMKTLLTDAFESAMKPVVQSFQQSNQQLQDQFSNLHTTIDSQSKILEEQLRITKNNGQDLSEQIVNQVTGGTQEKIGQFSDLLTQSTQIQSDMMNSLANVMNGFEQSKQQQEKMVTVTEELFGNVKETMNEMGGMTSSYSEASTHMASLSETMDKLQKLSIEQLPMQQEAIKSNTQLAEKYETITESMANFNDKVQGEYKRFFEDMAQASSTMSSSVEKLVSRFESSYEAQSETLKASKELLKGLQEAAASVSPMSAELKEVVGNLDNLKGEVTKMQQTQEKLLPELTSLRNQTHEVVQGSLEKTSSYVESIKGQVDSMNNHWKATEESFNETRETLDTSVRDFAGNIEKGLEKSHAQFDELLVTAINRVKDLVGQFSDAQEDFIETFSDVVDELEKKREVNR